MSASPQHCIFSAVQTSGMDMGRWTDPGPLGFFLTTWVVMLAAMMFPSVAPMVVAYARITHHRRETGLPPFGRLVRIVLRDQDLNKLHKLADELAEQLSDAIAAQGNAVRLKGPMPCAISRIAGYFRHQIVLSSPRAEALQTLLASVRGQGHLARSDRIAVDVDPVSLL